MTYYKPEQHLRVDKFMVPYFGKHGAKQLYRIHGNQLTLATSAVRTGKTVAMLCSIPSVSQDTCNTVKICHRFYFLDQGHSSVNMYISVLPIIGLLRGRTVRLTKFNQFKFITIIKNPYSNNELEWKEK